MVGGAGPEAAGRLAGLEARFHAFRAEVLKWQLEHVRYHRVNECRWGLVALMREHPLRTLAAGMVVGAVLGGGAGLPRLIRCLVEWLR
ncbi:MAG: hypothetical protein ACETWG_04340 [Candidatus Neomarinimicrobiota bacterium]